jgi:ribose transport system substrate-binding protein
MHIVSRSVDPCAAMGDRTTGARQIAPLKATGPRRSSRSRAPITVAAALVVAATVAACSSSSGGSTTTAHNTITSNAADSPITEQTALAPFRPSSEAGPKPNLPKVIAYVQDDPNETEQAIASGLKAGAQDSGLKFVLASSNSDPQTEVQDMQQELITGVGALVVGPVDPAAQVPVIQQAINKGVDVDTLVFGPGTDQVNAAQYAVGQALADAAAQYIETKLGGKANVVLLDQANVPTIVPRFNAIRAVLRTLPGVHIVADVTPSTQDSQGGYQTMNTILQKDPDVNVVLGSDEAVQGALAAMQAAHKASDRDFLGGLDGESSSLQDILEGGPYKATVALAPAIFGYAWAQYAADWLEGKNIPQAINVTPIALTSAAQIRAYESAEDDPAAVWNDKALLAKYLQMYGSISYATHEQYLAYSWPGITS